MTIYNELRRNTGKLAEFADVLVKNGFFSTIQGATGALRLGEDRVEIEDLYYKWRESNLKKRQKNTSPHNEKLREIFKELNKRKVQEKVDIMCELLEESLMCVTLAIKNNDTANLKSVKSALESVLYGDE